MKILFVYFKEKRICQTAEEAIDFINSLYYRNNPRCNKLVVNDSVKRILQSIYENTWDTSSFETPCIVVKLDTPYMSGVKKYSNGFHIRTTNCGNTFIEGCYPLGETVEEHDAEVERIRAEKAEQSRKQYEECLTKRHAELSEKREGWYSVSFTYERARMRDLRMVETTFSGKCIASSGMEAYSKTIKEIEKDGVASFNAVYPLPTSANFSFLFLGVKTDDGYTFKELEEHGSPGIHE